MGNAAGSTADHNARLLAAALAYAARGWKIFPVAANGKRPAPGIVNGYHDASSDETQIRNWWGGIFAGCNIGLALAPSGYVALDIDAYKPECEWSTWMHQHGHAQPKTIRQHSPRGGVHIIMRDRGASYPGKLCEGVEIKHHGYILLQPSVFLEREYRFIDNGCKEFCDAPDWLVNAREHASAQRSSEAPQGFTIDTGEPERMDAEDATQRALSGEEWHNNVVRLTARYVALGLSDDEIHRLTDPLTLPGYTVEQTRREVQTAINGARGKGFAPEKPQPEPETTAEGLLPFVPWAETDLSKIPHPEFVYGDFYAAGYTSVTLAAPKVGKSLLGLVEAVDMATGRGLLTGVPREPIRTIYFNAEDDQDVINERVSAILTHYRIPQSELAGMLYATSGVNWENFCLVAGADPVINEAAFAALERTIEVIRPGTAVFDPLQDLSQSPETNDTFRMLGRRLRKLASKHRVALGLVHHTRKVAPGQAPTIDDMRGGSALRGTARFNRLLVSMTEAEALKAGVPNHRHFFRIGDVESNLAPPSSEVNRWLQKVSVKIPNGFTAGVVEPWTWPSAFDGVTVEHATRVRAQIDRLSSPPRRDKRSDQWVGKIIGPIIGVDVETKPGADKVDRIVAAWVKEDVLKEVSEFDKRHSRHTKYVICGSN